MLRKILSGLAALAVLAGLGFGAASLASASSSGGGFYVRGGDANHFVHWYASRPSGYYPVTGSGNLGVTAPTPTVTVTASPTTVGGGSGTAAAGTFLIEGNTTGTTVTVTAPEAYFSANPGAFLETYSTNAASAPIGKTVTVTPVVGVEPTAVSKPSDGSYERTFKVVTKGFKAGESFSLTIGVTDNP